MLAAKRSKHGSMFGQNLTELSQWLKYKIMPHCGTRWSNTRIILTQQSCMILLEHFDQGFRGSSLSYRTV